MTTIQFKQATWDWIQNATTAEVKWGHISSWNTSAVTDMSYAFSNVVHLNSQCSSDKIISKLFTSIPNTGTIFIWSKLDS